MGWIVGVTLLGILFLVFMFLGAYLRGNGDQKETGGWMMVAGVICLIVVAIWSGTTSFKPLILEK